MKSLTRAVALLGLLAGLANPAWANWDIKLKASCQEAGASKLAKLSLAKADLISYALGQIGSGLAVAGAELVFDSDTRRLTVVRRCDAAVLYVFASEGACQEVATQKGATSNYTRSCLLVFEGADEGTALGSEKESYNESSGAFTFKGSYSGQFLIDGLPCAIGWSTGKLFETSGICPNSL